MADVRERILYMQELGVEILEVGPGEYDASEEAIEAFAKPIAVDSSFEPVRSATMERRSRLAGLPSLRDRTQIARNEILRSVSSPDPNRPPNPAIPVVPDTPVIPEVPVLPEPSSVPETPAFPIDPDVPVVPEIPVVPAVPGGDVGLFGDTTHDLHEAGETIEDIRADIGECTRCELYTGRTQVVHSTGNFQADLMFVGEAPGADEDAQGFPFVGRAGQLLTRIIEGIGLKREDVFIGNINRCRPPGNRAPTLPEAHTCRPFLLREIAVVRPKVIVVMGNTALHNLLDTKVGITRIRGQFQDYFGVKVMPTFHPAYLLRDPRKKREVWEDMKKVRDYLKDKG